MVWSVDENRFDCNKFLDRCSYFTDHRRVWHLAAQEQALGFKRVKPREDPLLLKLKFIFALV